MCIDSYNTVFNVCDLGKLEKFSSKKNMLYRYCKLTGWTHQIITWPLCSLLSVCLFFSPVPLPLANENNMLTSKAI